MKTFFKLLPTIPVFILTGCAITAESKITYDPTKAPKSSVVKVLDRNGAKAAMTRVDIPNQPDVIGYTDDRAAPGPIIFTLADLKGGVISISQGLVASPTPKMREYEAGLRNDLGALGVSPH